MNFVNLYREDLNIWEQNPLVKKIKPFDELYKKDKDGFKLKMIYLFCDPKSPLSNLTDSERKEDIKENFFGKKKFSWAEHEEFISAYYKYCTYPSIREYNILKQEVHDRGLYLRKLSWSDDEERYLKLELEKDQDKLIQKVKDLESLIKEELTEEVFRGEDVMTFIEDLADKAK